MNSLGSADSINYIDLDVFNHKPTREKGQDIRTLPTYTIPEAASYLAIDQWTLWDWYSGAEPLLKPSGYYGDAGAIALLSFHDMEEAYKLHLLRTKHAKSMQYLRKALADFRSQTKSDHPLAKYNVFAFDLMAFEKPARGRHPRQMIPLGAAYQLSLYIPEVVEFWGERIVVDNQGKALRLFPWKNAAFDKVSRPVSIDPEVMSGRLVVTGTRIPVDVLAGYLAKGKRVEEIADLYDLDVSVVRNALAHIERPQLHQAS